MKQRSVVRMLSQYDWCPYSKRKLREVKNCHNEGRDLSDNSATQNYQECSQTTRSWKEVCKSIQGTNSNDTPTLDFGL